MTAIAASLPRFVVHIGQLSMLCFDGFVVALGAVVMAATFLPCHGASAQAFGLLGKVAIAALFFLQGARLSRAAVVAGMTHWRLHLMIASTTFLLFPLLGIMMTALVPSALPHLLWLGVLFACVLPSTVQSSIALTSIARGNVAGAVCAATASNLVGIVVTPILFTTLANINGGVIDKSGIWVIILQLLVPFLIGHLLRPRLGDWAERNRPVLAITDRGSILLVVYTAFSAAVVHGIWRQVPAGAMESLVAVVALLLAAAVTITIATSRLVALSRSDEATVVFCGSQKSLISGVPIANTLFSGPAVGLMLLPIMLYYPVQLLIGAGLARWYAARSA